MVGHVPRSITTTRALELGMDCLEHIRITGGEMLKEDAEKIDHLGLAPREALLWQRFEVDSVGINKVIALIAKKRVFLDPTLVIDATTAKLTQQELNDDPQNSILPTRGIRALDESREAGPMEAPGRPAAGFDRRF